MARPPLRLTERVAAVTPITVQDTFHRHAAPNRDAFAGAPGGRWGANFPVIYLGQPTASVVVEAYRHLVDAEGQSPDRVRPRVLYTVPVAATRILNLLDPANLQAVGLTTEDLATEVDDYDACQRVAAAAHQLKWHGILAPASHGLGTTLALFRDRLPILEIPQPSAQTAWPHLPPDPRRLHLVETATDDETPATEQRRRETGSRT